MSTLSREENMVVLSGEVCSSTAYPDGDDDAELELGLGLSLGGGGGKGKSAAWGGGGGGSGSGGGGGGGQYARILTAKDFPSAKSSSSSSSSSSGAKACGTKRAADSASPPRSGVSQVVGWPPVRTYRINNLNQAKTPATEEFTSTFEKGKSKSNAAEKVNSSSDKNNNSNLAKGLAKTSLFVKVNMDGIPIGRKVDLNAHSSYEALAKTLDDMFCRPSTAVIVRRGLNVEEQSLMLEATRSLRLLDESSEFVLTYEDKEGDWMLVGDVPWEMFLSSVKRLRIMKTSEANGLAPRCQERSGRQRTKPI